MGWLTELDAVDRAAAQLWPEWAQAPPHALTNQKLLELAHKLDHTVQQRQQTPRRISSAHSLPPRPSVASSVRSLPPSASSLTTPRRRATPPRSKTPVRLPPQSSMLPRSPPDAAAPRFRAGGRFHAPYFSTTAPTTPRDRAPKAASSVRTKRAVGSRLYYRDTASTAARRRAPAESAAAAAATQMLASPRLREYPPAAAHAARVPARHAATSTTDAYDFGEYVDNGAAGIGATRSIHSGFSSSSHAQGDAPAPCVAPPAQRSSSCYTWERDRAASVAMDSTDDGLSDAGSVHLDAAEPYFGAGARGRGWPSVSTRSFGHHTPRGRPAVDAVRDAAIASMGAWDYAPGGDGWERVVHREAAVHHHADEPVAYLSPPRGRHRIIDIGARAPQQPHGGSYESSRSGVSDAHASRPRGDGFLSRVRQASGAPNHQVRATPPAVGLVASMYDRDEEDDVEAVIERVARLARAEAHMRRMARDQQTAHARLDKLERENLLLGAGAAFCSPSQVAGSQVRTTHRAAARSDVVPLARRRLSRAQSTADVSATRRPSTSPTPRPHWR